MITMRWSILFIIMLLFYPMAVDLYGQAPCTVSNWGTLLANDCGDLQASGGLAQGSPVIFCEGQTVTVENNSSPVAEVQQTYIDWGDGPCQTLNGFQTQLTHVYDFPNDTCITSSTDGTLVFHVRLGVGQSCSPNLQSFNSVEFNVKIRFKPIAGFSAFPNVLCVNTPVNFSNTSCGNSNTAMYEWNFGDGTSSTLEDPGPHTYAVAGTYTVTLKVTNSCGMSTFVQTISVTPPATAAATPSTSQLCAGGNVTFTNQSANAVGYAWMVMPATGWIFTNGTQSNSANPVIRFTAPGMYTVKLKVNGCGNPEWMTTIEVLAPPAVNIIPIPDDCAAGQVTINPSASLGGSGVTVTWQFPGGSPATGSGMLPGPVSYTGPGIYIISATTSANICGLATDMDTFSVAPAATAVFTLSDQDICGPDEIVTVTNTSANASNYLWSVAPNAGFQYVNGTSSSSPQPQFKFTAEGDFTITLSINACGSPTASAMVHVVLKPAVSLMPTADKCEQMVTLSPAGLSAFSGGASDSTQWTFLNGSIPNFNGQNPPPVTFTGAGLYAITVMVSNGCGSQTVTDTFQILAPATAAATIADDSLCAPAELLVVSTNTSTFASAYQWTVAPAMGSSFVNGTSATSTSPQLAFTQEGTFTLTLQVVGCGSPTWDTVVHVLLTPVVSLLPEIPAGCVDFTINPLDYGQISGGMAQNISWTFGGGQPATASGPNPGPVQFSGYGPHFLALVAQNACGLVQAVDSFDILQPATIVLSPAGPLCNSAAAIQLQATPASNDGWTGVGTTPGGLFDPGLVPNSLLNTQVPLVYQYGAATCLVKDTLLVLVQGTVVAAGDDRGLCANAPALLLPASPNGGVWSGDTVTAGGGFDPAAAGNGPHVLVYTFTDPTTGCVNADTVLVTVLGPPAAALDSIGEVCVGVEIDFGPFSGGTGGSSCSWDFGDNTVSDQCDPLHTYTLPGTYTLILYVENAAGCKDTASVELQIVTPPNALFSTDVTVGCADLPVTITNQSALNGYTLYVWDYGDGRRDTLPQPGTITFYQGEQDTTYNIVLTAVNQCGEATDQHPVTVKPRPQVRFGPDVSSGCSPLEVNFNNVSVGDPDFYRWFVNGVPVDTQFQLAQQVFLTTDQDSTYYITLVAGNECGVDTVTHPVLVKPNPVTAFFNTDTLVGCQPFTVRLIDYSTQGLYISWDFGDSNVATGDTVVHTFVAAGQYLVREFVNNGCGFDTAEVTITVQPAPEVKFTHPPWVCLGSALYLQNTSPALAGSYWDFGDGTGDSTQTSPGHTFAQAGPYTITLTGLAVTTGCPNTASSPVEVKTLPQPAAMVADSFGCQPFVFTPQNGTAGTNFYVWDFGNGATSTAVAPTYIYIQPGAYTVSLLVTDLFGCQDTWAYAPLNVFPKPVAAYAYDQAELCVTPAFLQFQNQSVAATTYLWNFGSLGLSDLENPALQVANPLTLPVTLFAENQYLCRDTVVGEVRVYTQPALDFEPAPTGGCAPLPVFFENFSTGVNQYAWHFGDGVTDSAVSPQHTYEQAGQYTVTLYASADSLCFDSLRFTNLITVLPSPTAGFSYAEVTAAPVQPNGIFNFTDTSLHAVSWYWDFGDGTTSVQRHPTHRYYQNGPRTVTLIVLNHLGCPDTLVQYILPESFGGLFIPNAVSPESGEPGARVFLPVGQGLAEFDIAIFAANGEQVWHSNHLTEGLPDESWDGTYRGKLLPQGLYWWKARARFDNGRLWTGMKYDGEAPVTEGKVLLIR